MRMGTKRQFGVTDLLWPLVTALFSVAGYFLTVLIIHLLNLLIKSTLLSLIVSSLFRLLYTVFGLALVSSYAKRFQRISGLAIVVPFLMSLSITLVVYFIAYMLEEINKLVGAEFISSITQFAMERVLYIFVIVFILSYAVSLLSSKRQKY